ncbi:hypothetical protein AB0I53_08085 [Saccharopolyspora sp. NPDC050389]|uniref:hypothetical protein n=1 Tax=Saccharopolyspora sp. NPDC050389 TaxID=3155516 RepID=UPI0033CF3DDA
MRSSAWTGAGRRRELLRRISRGQYGRRKGWPHVPELSSPWQDTVAAERDGWRTRAANLDGEGDHAFAVDYRVCRRRRLGWVENPYTPEHLQRCGLASAGLAALRQKYGLSWHTLGGRGRDSHAFWGRRRCARRLPAARGLPARPPRVRPHRTPVR